ncbi:hypothetical protein CANCADRAFT_68796 [Tortispora caseinolytica NRRL Y-17796]|uniref:quinol--cytochrome-c reductase n=1 Tax=Tortispora caseinolytica NRRL Y-17796 TaxID=767744 RepID=A0A1E4TG49_9ASCO|nr:hypothetical protein CANCADRAFT_68796 [Tortispora caseinolytica NRRL Y-17796]
MLGRSGAFRAYKRGVNQIKRGISTVSESSRPSTLYAVGVSAGALGLAGWYYHMFVSPAQAMTMAEHGLHPPKWPWYHDGMLHTFDHASLRRGFQVYKEVCSQCHSLSRIAWRSLVGVTHTANEAREMAEEFEYDDEPNDEGIIEKRPGKLADYIPAPYPNEEAARAGNQGAFPPDLSLIIKARHGHADYIFSLLTGYPDEPPAGVSLGAGMNYNPYFPGGGIGMARVLFDGLVEYDDGTPATTSQMAKDVTTFLNWTSEPEHDERKRAGLRYLIIVASLYAVSLWIKRFKWTPMKTRKIVYTPPKK